MKQATFLFLLALLPAWGLAQNCNLNVTPNGPVCPGEELTFTSTTNLNDAPLTYQWNFGDGSFSGDSATTSHSYPFNTAITTYTVELIVTDTAASCTTQQVVTVNYAPPVSVGGIFFDSTLCGNALPCNTTFTAQLYITGPTAGTQPFIWNLGDGSTTTSADTVTHTYIQFGTYPVTLTAPGATCPSFTRDVRFYTRPNIPEIMPPDSNFCEDELVQVEIDSSVFQCPGNVEYYVVFWDYNTPPSTVPSDTFFNTNSISRVYDLPYSDVCNLFLSSFQRTIRLEAVNACTMKGALAWDSNPLNISVAAEPEFSFNNVLCWPIDSTVNFTNASCPQNFQDQPLSYIWDFGDPASGANNTSTDLNPSHTFSGPGVYNVTLTATNQQCGPRSITKQVTILEPPVADITAPTDNGCGPLDIAYVNNSTPATLNHLWQVNPPQGINIVPDNDEASPTITYPGPGVYFLSYRASNACGTEFFRDTITVRRPPQVDVAPLGDSCNAAVLTPTATVDNNLATTISYDWDFGGAATPPTGANLIAGPVSFPLGPHTVTLTATNECGSDSDSESFTLYNLPPVLAGDDDTLCVGDPQLCLTPSPAGGAWFINGLPSPDGCVDPVSPGLFQLVYDFDTTLSAFNNLQCRFRDTAFVEVRVPPVVDAGPDLTLCVGDTAVLTGSPLGGTFLSGLNILNGSFIAVSPGTYPIDYAYVDSFGCENTDQLIITVPTPPAVEVGAPQTFCLADAVVNLAGNTTPLGGSWSGPGIVDPATGDFNPDSVGVGMHQVFYTIVDANGCENRDTLVVNVDLPQVPQVMADFSICRNAAPVTLTATPPGGTWNPGPVFDPLPAPSGSQEYVYTLFPGTTCEARDTLTVFVNDTLLTEAGANLSACVDADTITLTGFSPGTGVWSGTGIVDPAGRVLPGLIGASNSALLTYTVTSDSGCVSQDVLTFTVNPLPAVAAGNDQTFCITGGPQQLTGFSPANGTWTGPGVTAAGLFDPVVTGLGNFTLTLTFTDANACTNFDSLMVTVIEPDSVSAGPDDSVCVSVAPYSLPGFVPVGGVWTGSGVNAAGTFDPAAAGVGTHQLIYTLAGGTTCEQSDTVLITVFPLPVVNTGPDLEACVGDALVPLTSGTPVAGGTGVWTGTGVSFVAGQYVFDPATVGTFSLTYTFTNDNGCSDSASLDFTVHPLPVVVAGANQTFCITGGPQQLTGFSPLGGSWTGPGVTAGGLFDPVTTGLGNFTLTYTFTDGNTCVNLDSLLVTVIEPDSVSAGPDDSVCVNAGIVTLGNFFPMPPVGSWSGPGIVDPVQGTFDPVVAGVGTFTLTYCTGSGTCLICDSMEMTVLPLPPVAAFPDSMCITDPPLLLGTGQAYGQFTPGVWSGTGVTFLGGNDYRFGPLPVGSYPVVYTFTDSLGCTNQDTTTIAVNPQPVAGIAAPGLVCTFSPASFVDQSTNAVGYRWDFGVPNSLADTAVVPNPVFTYTDTGIYTVTLIVTSPSGCTDTSSTQVQVSEVPEPGFALSVDTACAVAGALPSGENGLLVTITDTSNAAGGSYFWDYGGGADVNGDSTAQVANPPGVYFVQGPSDTTYTVSLSIFNGCDTVTVTRSLTLRPVPVVAFAPDTSIDCSPFCPQLNNLSLGNPDSYLWQVDGNTVSTDSIPSNLCLFYNQTTGDTTYTLSLIATNACGADTSFHDVTVLPNNVNAFFNTSLSSGCPPLRVDVISLANAPNSWFAFGDAANTTTTDDTASFTYTIPGTYFLRHAAFNNCAADTDTITIVVFPVADVGIQTSANSVCTGIGISFRDSVASPNVTGYLWDFGDGVTSQQASPTHAYAAPGTYQVVVTGQSVLGPSTCPVTDTVQVTILPPPPAFFTASDTFGCPPLTVAFSGVPTGPGYAYFWEFGDGTTATGPTASHLYAQTGNFTARLTVFNADSCFATATQTIQVFEQPGAAFSWTRSDSCGGPDTLTFANLSTGSLLSYAWDFGDGSSSTQANPQHVYAQPGVYVVELVAQTAFACADTSRDTVEVYPQPVASLNVVPAQGCAPLPAAFTAGASNFTDFFFDFGDGTNTATPFSAQTHVYDVQQGSSTFSATLFLSYENVCFDTASVSVNVNSRPLAVFAPLVDSLCGTPAEVGFVNSSTDAIGGLSYAWTFGDGNGSTDENPLHSYAQTGSFTVQLIATNDSACTDTAVRTVTVLPQPQARIIPDQDLGCYDLPVSFRLAQPDSATRWQWDFGDGTRVSGTDAPQHLYTDEGTYLVEVRIDTAGFCFATDTALIRVGAPPVADFTLDVEGECADTVFANVTNTSFNADAYRWDFGDGRRSSEFEPDIFYTRPDSYRVVLIAINSAFGCRDTTEQQVPYLRAIADFDLAPLAGCTPLAVIPVNLSTGANTYSWDFGDGSTRDTRENPAHVYRQPGEFTVTLYVSFSGICRDTLAFPTPVSVTQSPEAQIVAAPLSPPGNWLFSDNSVVVNPPHAVRWDLGEGTTSNEFSFQHQFERCGYWDIELLVTDAAGCADTAVLDSFGTGVGTLFLPNAVAPNAGSGDFTLFWPRGVGLDTFHIAIYNDWGNLIWERRSHDASGNVLTYPDRDGREGPVLDENGSPSRDFCGWDGHIEKYDKDGTVEFHHPVMPGVYTWVIHKAWYCGGREYNGKRDGTVTVVAGDR